MTWLRDNNTHLNKNPQRIAMRKPTKEQIEQACLEARSDFKTMGPVAKSNLIAEALFWLQVWEKVAATERSEMAEFINELSEIFVGYREGREPDLLEKAKELMEISKQHQRQEQIATLFEAIRDLNAVASDIEADA